jgi:hypothetical protein
MSDLSPLCAPKQTSVDYSDHYRLPAIGKIK